MAYLGKGTKSIDHATISTHTMTGNGSDTTMSITLGTTSVNNVSVFISGVQQRPGQDYTIANDVITFTTAPAAGWPVIAFVRKDTKKGTIADASVGLDTIKDGAVTDAKIVGLSASKLTGALPAIDGSALTGISAVTTSATDPAIDTNPTLGAVWVNKTSGNTFVCTDATTDANIWTNVGGGSGDIQPFVYQGTSYGYSLGGYQKPPAPNYKNYIQKYSFASSSTSTTPGSLLNDRNDGAGGVSTTHGWLIGGTGGEGNPPSAPGSKIEKFAFASDAGNVTVGDLQAASVPSPGMGSETSSSGDYIYAAWSVEANYASNNWIERISTTTDGDASGDIGNLTIPRIIHAQMSSDSYAYTSGGTGGSLTANIERFAFAANVTSASVGNLTAARGNAVGISATTDGYNS